MAETVVPAGDATAVTVYSKRVYQHAIRMCTGAKLMAVGLKADDQTNFVQYFDELAKGPGDTIKYDLVPNVIGPGVRGDNPIAGQEAAFAALQDSFVIDQHRQAILLKGRMSQQRVPYSMRDSARVSLSNWVKEILDVGLFNQLCGNTSQTNLAYTGMQTPVAADTAHQLYASTATAESQLTSSTFNFSLDLITKAVAKAQGTLQFPIKPVVIKGLEIAGILFLHPLQVRDLKNTFTSGGWGDIYKAALQGGQITGNPIFTGAIGMYNGVVIHQDAHVVWGDNAQNLIYDPVQATTVPAPTNLGAAANGTTSVARAVFVGAQAAAFALGAADSAPNGSPLRVKWVEELLDAQNQLRITGGLVYGIRKSRFASQDYGTITISTYAAP